MPKLRLAAVAAVIVAIAGVGAVVLTRTGVGASVPPVESGLLPGSLEAEWHPVGTRDSLRGSRPFPASS